MRELWGWVVAGVLAGAGLVVAAWLALRGRPGARRAAIDALEAWHREDIESMRRRADELARDFEANAGKIGAIERRLADKVAALEASYVDAGLTADEIVERFQRVGL